MFVTVHSQLLALSLVFAVVCTGCGKQETAQTPAQPQALAAANTSGAVEAEAVVSQFLDRIRRGGGADNGAVDLLTDRARSELQRIGHSVQPIGSPDASFTVTRSERAPDSEQVDGTKLPSRLVHCIWSEPAEIQAEATQSVANQDCQVVWAVVQQPNGWRISGLVMEMSPEEPPIVLDFENGDMMAQILGGNASAETAAAPAGQSDAPATSIR